MTTLADLLSALVTEFTIARAHADLEAVRLSEVYRQAPLLEGAPIPRFRLPELTVDLPVGVDAITGAADALSHQYPAWPDAVGKESIEQALALSQIELTLTQRAHLARELARQVKKLWLAPLELVPAFQIITQLVRHVGNALLEMSFDPPRALVVVGAIDDQRLRALREFQRALQARLHEITLGSSAAGPRLDVIARTSALREIKEAGLLVRLNLTLREDGVELVKINREDGTTAERLVPE